MPDPFFDFENSQVQRELFGSSFVKGESTLIAAGPPYLTLGNAQPEMGIFTGNPQTGSDVTGLRTAMLGGIPVFPIGVVENANVSQQKSVRRIPEIGSKRFHFITGRTVANLSLSRVLFNGPSLLRVLYAYIGKSRFLNLQGGDIMDELLYGADGTSVVDDYQVASAPGYKDFFVNLDSNLFDIPFGLMFYMEDSKKSPYGAYYCTEAYISTHQMNIGATADVIGEGVSIIFDRVVPIDIQASSAAERPS